MSDICRLCGDLKPLESLSCLKDCTVAYSLEKHLKISLEGDKMLPNSVCDNCCQNVSFCCEFIDQVNTVQLRLKADLAEQLQMVIFDPFIADGESRETDMKIERIYPESENYSIFQPGGSNSLNKNTSAQNTSNKQHRFPDKKGSKTVSREIVANRQRGKFTFHSLTSICNVHLL